MAFGTVIFAISKSPYRFIYYLASFCCPKVLGGNYFGYVIGVWDCYLCCFKIIILVYILFGFLILSKVLRGNYFIIQLVFGTVIFAIWNLPNQLIYYSASLYRPKVLGGNHFHYIIGVWDCYFCYFEVTISADILFDFLLLSQNSGRKLYLLFNWCLRLLFLLFWSHHISWYIIRLSFIVPKFWKEIIFII